MNLGRKLQAPAKDLGSLRLYYLHDIAVIVFDGGENRLNPTFIDKFNELLDNVESNNSCKGLITKGQGKFYSNGLDLKWLKTVASPQERQDFIEKWWDLMRRILLFPVPTLAAINGHAFAGGALLAFAHDLRVQQQSRGWICINEVWIDMRLGRFLTSYVRTKIGNGRNYTDCVVLGKRYTATEALHAGLVHAAPQAPLLLTESIHLLKSFYGKSGYPRESLYLMKQDVYKDALDIFESGKQERVESEKRRQSKL